MRISRFVLAFLWVSTLLLSDVPFSGRSPGVLAYATDRARSSGGTLPQPVTVTPGGGAPAGRSAVNFNEYIFPALMRALYTDAPHSVPDMQAVRGYYASIETVFNRRCSENVNPHLAVALNAYLSEDARAIQNNPQDLAAWGKLLEKAVRDPARMPLRLSEGEDDAETFLKRYPCQSPPAVTLRANLHKLVFARKNVPVDPPNEGKLVALINPSVREELGIALQPIEDTPAERMLAACYRWREDMKKRVPYADDGPTFCRCLAPQLASAPLEASERDRLLADFGDTYLQLMKTKSGLVSRVMAACQR